VFIGIRAYVAELLIAHGIARVMEAGAIVDTKYHGAYRIPIPRPRVAGTRAH
jgi:hypothetical protein